MAALPTPLDIEQGRALDILYPQRISVCVQLDMKEVAMFLMTFQFILAVLGLGFALLSVFNVNDRIDKYGAISLGGAAIIQSVFNCLKPKDDWELENPAAV
jgi:hypothetical protein